MSAAYRRYLASREWALKREAVRQRSNNHCERCLVGPQDAVNHLQYSSSYEEPFPDEPLEWLQAICDECHAFLSAKSDEDPIKRRRLHDRLGRLLRDRWEETRGFQIQARRAVNDMRCEATRLRLEAQRLDSPWCAEQAAQADSVADDIADKLTEVEYVCVSTADELGVKILTRFWT
jgi:hypothetical protein